MDDDQKAVVKLPGDKSYLVLGPPGSGKTNLLLLRAQYHILSGRPNIAVVSFTRMLQRFISHGLAQYDIPEEKVMTLHQWQSDLLWDAGIDVPRNADFEIQRKAMLDATRSLVKKRKMTGAFDAILLDEAQDYLPEEIELFRELGDVLYAVADSRQKIYTGDDPLKLLRRLVDGTKELPFHYRNGLKICRVADKIAKNTKDYQSLESSSNYKEKLRPSQVERVRCATPEQVSRLVERVTTQLKTYPDEFIGVLVPRKEDFRTIVPLLAASSLAPKLAVYGDGDEPAALDPGRTVWVCTVHGAKGLEFRAVHILAAEGFKRFKNQRNMTYVAVTRAKTSLSVYHEAPLAGYFESALVSLEDDVHGPPELEDLFGGRK